MEVSTGSPPRTAEALRVIVVVTWSQLVLDAQAGEVPALNKRQAELAERIEAVVGSAAHRDLALDVAQGVGDACLRHA